MGVCAREKDSDLQRVATGGNKVSRLTLNYVFSRLISTNPSLNLCGLRYHIRAMVEKRQKEEPAKEESPARLVEVMVMPQSLLCLQCS
jgi:hypothetical protein